MSLKFKTPKFLYPGLQDRLTTIRVSFSLQLAKTPTYPVIIDFPFSLHYVSYGQTYVMLVAQAQFMACRAKN